MKPILAGLGLAAAVGSIAGAQPPPADLVLRNGRIVTVDEATPEAPALAARGSRKNELATEAPRHRVSMRSS